MQGFDWALCPLLKAQLLEFTAVTAVLVSALRFYCRSGQFLVIMCRNARLNMPTPVMFAGVHTALVCVCGADNLQVCPQELLHPQGACGSGSWARSTEADPVQTYLEDPVCLLHYRYCSALSTKKQICFTTGTAVLCRQKANGSDFFYMHCSGSRAGCAKMNV